MAEGSQGWQGWGSRRQAAPPASTLALRAQLAWCGWRGVAALGRRPCCHAPAEPVSLCRWYQPAASNEEEEEPEEEDKEEGPLTRKRAAVRAASAPTNGKKARGEGLGVRSNSSAALAMLAGAAAGKTGDGGGGGGGGATSSTPQAAPAAEAWQGHVPGSQMGSGSGSEPGLMTADQAALMVRAGQGQLLGTESEHARHCMLRRRRPAWR